MVERRITETILPGTLALVGVGEEPKRGALVVIRSRECRSVAPSSPRCRVPERELWPVRRSAAGCSHWITGRRGSARARRLVVLSVADVRAPGGALALLAGFRQRQMREQAIGRRAVPVHRIRRDIYRIARVQHLRLLALEADAADAGQTEERLPNRVGVPRGACARRERNRTSKARRAPRR